MQNEKGVSPVSSSCTIYSPRLDFNTPLTILRHYQGGHLEIKNAKGHWTTLTLITGESQIVFSSLWQQKPGDEFSRLILGTHNYFRMIGTQNKRLQNQLLHTIAATNMVIGVKAIPDFDESVGHFDLIFAIAETLDGMIFNGNGMIDYEGKMILDADGTTEQVP